MIEFKDVPRPGHGKADFEKRLKTAPLLFGDTRDLPLEHALTLRVHYEIDCSGPPGGVNESVFRSDWREVAYRKALRELLRADRWGEVEIIGIHLG